MKSLIPIKAKPLDDDELTAWFEGRVSRRLLAIPFGGPIPSQKSSLGVDLDGEWFSPRTDIYGSHAILKRERERPVDFHHSLDPTGMMGETLIGKSILDPDPDEDGWWVDVWLKAGEKRLALIKRLVERGAQLFGSSQAASKKADTATGEILEWPFIVETLSTSPQNTYSRFAKASVDYPVSESIQDFITSLDNLGSDLGPTSRLATEGAGTAKAGRVSLADLRALRDTRIALEALASQKPPTEGDASE